MQVAAPSHDREDESRFNRHARRLRERHGARVWRVGVDAGFGCPNRSAGRGEGGCSYCAPSGSAAPYTGEPGTELEEQLGRGLAFLRHRYNAGLFFLYFQAFSSTNAPPDRLRRIYDSGLAQGGDQFRGLVVSTRPDCVDEGKAALLAGYADRGLEVWVELGLQSANDRTLRAIGRGHDVAAFVRACSLLRLPGIRVAAHLMLGLPGESREDMLASVDLVAQMGLAGVKFHDLQLARGSRLAAEYELGELALISRNALPVLLADCLERLPPSCEVIRLCADIPPVERLVPRQVPDKALLYRAVEAELHSRGSRQGSAWREPTPEEARGN